MARTMSFLMTHFPLIRFPISHLYNQIPDDGWPPAVDANVGKALFRSAIQGLVAQGKTVLLVTHALHFLAQCDYNTHSIAEVSRAYRTRG
jgi:hypothetical protein